jgi:hypothetical protein
MALVPRQVKLKVQQKTEPFPHFCSLSIVTVSFPLFPAPLILIPAFLLFIHAKAGISRNSAPPLLIPANAGISNT